MQTNGFVGQIQQGTRLPEMDQAHNDTRAMPESRAERRGADGSRRTGTKLGTTRLLRRYGAGY